MLHIRLGPFTLFTISGIPIRTHLLTILWVLGFCFLLTENTVSAIMLLLAVCVIGFGSILLHELGHALAAAEFGIKTERILLHPLGGAARVVSTGHTPKQMIVIALAGPLVSAFLFCIPPLAFMTIEVMDPMLWHDSLFYQLQVKWALQFSKFNLFILGFNLLPIYPLDGGRALDGFLTLVFTRIVALRVIRSLSFSGSLGLIIFAFWSNQYIFAIFGVVIMVMGESELSYRMGKVWKDADKKDSSNHFLSL